MFDKLRSYVKRRWMRIRGQFPRLWKNYLYQSLFAAVVVFIILLILSIENAVVIASIGASAFIAFTMPRQNFSRPRYLIGGYIVGILCLIGSSSLSVINRPPIFTGTSVEL